MNSTMKLFGFFLFALALSFMACKGEDGAIGPVGPAGTMGVAGEAGPDGPTGMDGRDGADGADGQNGTNGTNGEDGQNGQNGQNGQDGEDGNANVFTSDWGTIDWDPSSTFGFFDFTAPEITAEVLDKALILGFVRIVGNSWVYGLPLTWINGDYLIQYAANVNRLEFYYSTETAGTTPDFEGRYMIIPPAGRHAAHNNPKQAILNELSEAGIDITDYNQVAKHLNIFE